jgi:hypothetical protein
MKKGHSIVHGTTELSIFFILARYDVLRAVLLYSSGK